MTDTDEEPMTAAGRKHDYQSGKAPVVDYIDPYLQDRMRRHELTPLTARNVRSSLGRFATSCGDRPLRNIGPRHVEDHLGDIGHLSAATRRGALSMIRSFARWLVRRDYARKCFTDEVPAVKTPRHLPRALPAEAVGEVLAMCGDERARLMVLLMVQEGLRCVEVSGVEVGDVDFLRRTVRVTGKGGHQRVLPISDETYRCMSTYLTEYPATSGPLIRSYLQPWRPLNADTISGMVSELMRGAGVKRFSRDGVSAHALRHTMATDAIRSGAHLRDVQHALGHAHLATTEVYLPLIVNDLKSAMGGREYRGAQHRPGADIES